MRTFATRRPVLFASLASLALVLVQYLWLFALPGLSDTLRMVAAKVSECLLGLCFLGALGWWREAGFVAPWRWRAYVPALPLLIIPLLMGVSQFSQFRVSDPARLIVFGAVAAMTGFAEEAVFRGITLHALLPKGRLAAALWSSAIFGLVHAFNLLAGADPLATAVQIAAAMLFGLAFAAPLLYSGSIWPIILVHALQDFLSFWSMGGFTNTATPAASEVLVTLVVLAPFALYGLWLIRRPAPPARSA